MIVVQIIGGLGNQCFQYAFGRALAEKHRTTLKLDLSAYATYKWHAYSLHHFNIEATVASAEEIAALTPRKEPHFHFDPDVLAWPDGLYASGYFSTEKYFGHDRARLLDEFSVRSPLAGLDADVAKSIMGVTAVGVHVRRADYLPNTYAVQIFETCGLNYYERAVEHVGRLVAEPHFFVFSDDPGWARENFVVPYPTTIVGHNGADKNYEDLRLLSLCRHHIIANSTFSWWGAWLSRNPTKIVCAPDQWFSANARNSSKDLIPSSWVRL